MGLTRIRIVVFLISVICCITVACSDNTNSENCANKDKVEEFPCKDKYENNDSKKSLGIDVSHHNGEIDWNLLRSKHDLDFVYIKATEGATHVDKNYFKNVDGASSVGYLIGSYHFFRMTSGAHEQFKNFYSTVLSAGNQSLIPMVDVETNDGHPISELRDSLNVFMSLIKKEFGVYPMIYGTNRSYNEYCGSKYNKYHLYIGRYGDKPPIVNGIGHYTIWQYSEKGRLSGIPKPVDIAKFHPDYSSKDILLAD